MASSAWQRLSGKGSAAVIVGAGLDFDGAVAAGGADELPDPTSRGVFDPPADDEGGEHDRQMSVDRVALVLCFYVSGLRWCSPEYQLGDQPVAFLNRALDTRSPSRTTL
jgi:hypothetical protein